MNEGSDRSRNPIDGGSFRGLQPGIDSPARAVGKVVSVPNGPSGTIKPPWWRRVLGFHKKAEPVADTSIALLKPATVGDRREQLTESSLSTDATSDCHLSAEAKDGRQYRITARGIRGLQIGEGNRQINTYEYEVERPNIDFAAVLNRAHVREALKALSHDPGNADLQRKADKLLAQGPLFRKKPELRVEENGMSSEQESSLFDAFSFIQNCTGVQIGNAVTQKNRFLYVVAPTLDARQFLVDDPGVRAAIIDCVCSTDKAGSEDVLRAELAVALEAAVLNSPDIRTEGDQIQVPAYGVVTVVQRDGVQLDTGNDGQQENTASAVVVVPRSIVKSLQEERIIVQGLRQQDEKACIADEVPSSFTQEESGGDFDHDFEEEGDSHHDVTYGNEGQPTEPRRDEDIPWRPEFFGIGTSPRDGGVSGPSDTTDYGDPDDSYGGLDER